jgi:hypothetical protein
VLALVLGMEVGRGRASSASFPCSTASAHSGLEDADDSRHQLPMCRRRQVTNRLDEQRLARREELARPGDALASEVPNAKDVPIKGTAVESP